MSVSHDVATYFEAEGLMSPIINNKRKISTAMISPPSSRYRTPTPSASSSSGEAISPESFRAAYVYEEADEVELPARLESQETYVYLGFTEERAANLWERYFNHGEEPFGDFISFAIWHIEPRPDATSASDDWDACMKNLDINDKLRRAILLPEYEDIRYTASCKFWVLDAIVTAYNSLRGLNERLRNEARRRQHFQKIPNRKPAGSISQPPTLSSPTSRKPPKTALPLPQESETGAPLSPPTDAPQPSVATISAAPPAILEGHSVLWRGSTLNQAESFYNEQTQEITFDAMTSAPGDFSGRTPVGYFTPQREVADRYAQWTKQKLPDAEIAIVQVAVPDTLLRTLAVEYLWFKEDRSPTDVWKNLVWTSRRARSVPKELDYLHQKDLLIGHIASGLHCKYSQMTDYRRIRESDVLHVKIDGAEQKGIQWVFNTRKARYGFEEQCRGKIWIHRLGAFKVPKDFKMFG